MTQKRVNKELRIKPDGGSSLKLRSQATHHSRLHQHYGSHLQFPIQIRCFVCHITGADFPNFHF